VKSWERSLWWCTAAPGVKNRSGLQGRLRRRRRLNSFRQFFCAREISRSLELVRVSITVANGSEFVSRAMEAWTYLMSVRKSSGSVMITIGCGRTVRSMTTLPMTSQSGGQQGAQPPRYGQVKKALPHHLTFQLFLIFEWNLLFMRRIRGVLLGFLGLFTRDFFWARPYEEAFLEFRPGP
jgi:hypothetical protein